MNQVSPEKDEMAKWQNGNLILGFVIKKVLRINTVKT